MYTIFRDSQERDQKKAYALINKVHNPTLYNERLVILNSTGTVIFRLPDTLVSGFVIPSLEKVRSVKEYKYVDSNGFEQVTMYTSDTHSYVLVSGYDRNGFTKLNTLQLILVSVFLDPFSCLWLYLLYL